MRLTHCDRGHAATAKMPDMPTIPLVRVDDDDGLGGATFQVEVAVDGEACDLLLDTGAARTAIASNGFHGARRSEATDSRGAFGGHDVMELADVDLGIAGRVHRRTVRLAAAEEPPVLGVDVLGAERATYRFGVAEMVLGPDAAHVGSAQPLTIGPRGHPYVPMAWDGVRALAAWDTGASITLVDPRFVEENPSLFEFVGQGRGSDSTGTETSAPTVRMRGPVIGEVPFADSFAAVVDLSFLPSAPAAQLIVGHPILSQADWTVDGPAARWSVRLA